MTTKTISSWLKKPWSWREDSSSQWPRGVWIFLLIAVGSGLAVLQPTLEQIEITAKVLTATAVLFAIYVAMRRVQIADEQAQTAAKQAETAAQGHVTERFTKAVEQLGQESLALKFGGIYALERIAQEFSGYHCMVMEVLCAYAREYRPPQYQPGDEPSPYAYTGSPQMLKNTELIPEVAPYIQAILTVVGRRDTDAETKKQIIQLQGGYFSRARLLPGEAKLAGVKLTSAYLNVAYLGGADLTRAHLNGAYLNEAFLTGAVLREADLRRSELRKADLTGADLTEAKLAGADLTGATLTQEQLDSARGDWTTELPEGLNRPESWEKEPAPEA